MQSLACAGYARACARLRVRKETVRLTAQFETTKNPPNCGVAVMQRESGAGRYRLKDQYTLTQPTCEMIGCENSPISSPCLGRRWGKGGDEAGAASDDAIRDGHAYGAPG